MQCLTEDLSGRYQCNHLLHPVPFLQGPLLATPTLEAPQDLQCPRGNPDTTEGPPPSQDMASLSHAAEGGGGSNMGKAKCQLIKRTFHVTV